MQKLERDPRVLFITPFGFSRRGTLPYRLLPMVRVLDSRGVRVRVLVADWDGEPSPYIRYMDFGNKAQIYLIPLRQEYPGSAGYFYAWMQMFRMIWVLARTWHPDIVHLVKPIGPPFLFLAWHYFRTILPGGDALSAPILVDCDDLESAWSREGSIRFIWRMIGVKAEEWVWRHANTITTASHYLAERIQRIRSDSRIYLIPNIAPNVQISARPLSSQRLLIPTRLLDVKPTTMATWLESIVRSIPEANVLLVGPSRKESRRLQTNLAENVRNRIAILAWQKEEAYFHLLQRTRIGLYVVEDTPAARAKSPARLLSMMAAGVPIVATDVGESRYLLGDTGVVVSPVTNEIVSHIRALWHNKEQLVSLGQKARTRAQRMFNEENLAHRLATVYNAVLQE